MPSRKPMMQQTLFQAGRSSDADQLHDEEDHEEDDDELHACKKSRHQHTLHDGDDDQDADEDDEDDDANDDDADDDNDDMPHLDDIEDACSDDDDDDDVGEIEAYEPLDDIPKNAPSSLRATKLAINALNYIGLSDDARAVRLRSDTGRLVDAELWPHIYGRAQSASSKLSACAAPSTAAAYSAANDGVGSAITASPRAPTVSRRADGSTISNIAWITAKVNSSQTFEPLNYITKAVPDSVWEFEMAIDVLKFLGLEDDAKTVRHPLALGETLDPLLWPAIYERAQRAGSNQSVDAGSTLTKGGVGSGAPAMTSTGASAAQKKTSACAAPKRKKGDTKKDRKKKARHSVQIYYRFAFRFDSHLGRSQTDLEIASDSARGFNNCWSSSESAATLKSNTGSESAPPERVFSIMGNAFDDNQEAALNDYVELSLQLQYNARGRSCGA